jgi:DNA-binding PadR family transcriptional regulator
MPPDPRTFLPLRPAELVLLLVLMDGEQHGYALARAIETRSDGTIVLKPGNLYRVIQRLVDDGLVAESEHRPAPDADDERRRYYRITPLGGRVATAEVRRLHALLATDPVRALVPRGST